jgi:4-amino-4-deoxy-L-arabinose transferase-like glycosyltransferase
MQHTHPISAPAAVPSNRIDWTSPAAIFTVALCLRLLAMTIGHTYRFSHQQDDFGFGWETGRIARALALGHVFSDPLQGRTGPTAWIAPLYPFLLAGIFKLFGVYSLLSSWIALAINSCFSALNSVVVYRIADRLFGRRAALWSGWLWAAFPYAWYWAIHWQWETSLAMLLLSCVILLSLKIAGVRTSWSQELAEIPRRDWIWFGVANGTIALTNPSLLLFLPFAGVWALVHNARRERLSRALLSATFAGLIFLAMLTPWIVRNALVFDKFIPVRGNFWNELHLGNTEGTDGLWAWWGHPSHNPVELESYRRLGEVGYMERAKQQTKADIARNPKHFVRACFNRFLYYWYDTPREDRDLGSFSFVRNLLFAFTSVVAFLGAGLMLWRRHPAAWLFAWLLISVPFVYYFTFPHPRYRAPLEPLITVLGVHLFQSAERKKAPAR